VSQFSHQINDLIRKYGSAVALAKSTSIHPAIISRLANGKNPPDRETVRKLCTGTSDEDGSALLVAYLNDCIPEDCKLLAKATGLVRSEFKLQSTQESALGKLNIQTRETIEHLAKLCLEDPDFSEFVEKMVERFDPAWKAARRDQLHQAIIESEKIYQLTNVEPAKAAEASDTPKTRRAGRKTF